MIVLPADPINTNRKGRPCGIGLSEEGDGANFRGSPRPVAAIFAAGYLRVRITRRSYYIETPETPKSYDNYLESGKILRKTTFLPKKPRRLRPFYVKFYNRYSRYKPYSSDNVTITHSRSGSPHSAMSHSRSRLKFKACSSAVSLWRRPLIPLRWGL